MTLFLLLFIAEMFEEGSLKSLLGLCIYSTFTISNTVNNNV